MSLLDRGTDEITVYPEVVTTDSDGNPGFTKPDRDNPVGPLKARVQVQGQSGTSARRQEQDNEGFESEKVYRVRFPRGTQVFGAQSIFVWRGQEWAQFGDVNYYNSSPRTAHHTYTIRRS